MSARASVIYLASRVLSGALSVVAIGLFAHGLAPEDYAWLTLAMAGSALVAGVFIQPLHQSYARFFPRPGFENLLPTLVRLLLLFIAILLFVAWATELGARAWLPAGVALGAWALGAGQGIFDFSSQYANSNLQAQRYSTLYVVKAILVVAIGYLALRAGWGKVGALGAMVAAYGSSALTVSFTTWRKAWRGAWMPSLFATIKPYAIPLAASFFLAAVLQWADRLILAVLASKADTGAFSAAADLTQQGLGLISSAFFLAWYPRLVTASEQRDDAELQRLASRYATLALSLLLPAALGFALVRENLVHLLLGHAYADTAIAVIPWLALSASLAGLRSYMLDIPLHIANRMPLLLRNVGVCALSSVILNFCLVPVLGVVGAGVAAVLAQGIGCVLSYIYGRGVIRWHVPRRDAIAVLVACVAMAVAVLSSAGSGTFHFMMQILSGCMAYVSVMILFNAADCRLWIGDWFERRRSA
ncbi:MAG TPA: polysaccharide biosynthesis C-terminal domain-containing protein [Rhodocyclaceae bacterium]|nr:polysaccharide biosynthesis C-terminal domain-containing protein [Rhodocyclaceae bacterium]